MSIAVTEKEGTTMRVWLEGRIGLKRILSFAVAVLLGLSLLCPAAGEEDRPVLTIGDVNDRTSKRVDGENQLGMWRYLEDLPGVEIRYVHLSAEDYASGIANGNLPDIVSTNNKW